MRADNEKHLREAYPLVYGEPFLNHEPFRCGDGWFSILDDLGKQLQALIEAEPEEKRRRYRVVQVKEKFGGLRVYLDRYVEAMSDAIDAAERASTTTCERCGDPGSICTVGWVQTLCNPCRAVVETKRAQDRKAP